MAGALWVLDGCLYIQTQEANHGLSLDLNQSFLRPQAATLSQETARFPLLHDPLWPSKLEAAGAL